MKWTEANPCAIKGTLVIDDGEGFGEIRWGGGGRGLINPYCMFILSIFYIFLLCILYVYVTPFLFMCLYFCVFITFCVVYYSIFYVYIILVYLRLFHYRLLQTAVYTTCILLFACMHV